MDKRILDEKVAEKELEELWEGKTEPSFPQLTVTSILALPRLQGNSKGDYEIE